MRLTCPHCGERDQREFSYTGAALALFRPSADASAEEWDNYLHNRDNPTGMTRDLWHHTPCGTWVVVERDTVTHEIRSATPAREVER